VMGPPKVGKSTLIQCLIRNFTRQKLTEIRGPVTIVSGRGCCHSTDLAGGVA
jgi:ribosome biogenesis protein BMS1